MSTVASSIQKSTIPDDCPLAPAVLDRDRHFFLWRVMQCPLCGGSHLHGGGPLDGDPRQLLGHRLAHCRDRGIDSGGYSLIEMREGGK